MVWIGAIIITLVIVSPFFWLWFLKKRSKWRYVLVNSIASIIIFLIYCVYIYEYLLGIFAKINANYYYYFYDAGINVTIIFPFLLLISPFVFTRIIYEKITIKSFFVSFLLSVVIFTAFFLFFAYYIFPKAAEGFLINI